MKDIHVMRTCVYFWQLTTDVWLSVLLVREYERDKKNDKPVSDCGVVVCNVCSSSVASSWFSPHS